MKKPKLYFTRGELDRDKDGQPPKAKRKAVRRFSGKADDSVMPVRENAASAADGAQPENSAENVTDVRDEGASPVKSKLREKSAASVNGAAKLRFRKAENAPVEDKPVKAQDFIRRTAGKTAGKTAGNVVTSAVHRKVSEYEDDNVGVEAAHRTEQAAEGTARTVEAVRYGRKVRGHGSYDRLSGSGAREAFHSMKEKRMSLSPGAASNPISRWKQKQMIRDGYASARTAAAAGGQVSGTSMAGQAAASFPASVRNFFLGSDGNSVIRMIAGKMGNGRPVLIILGICAMVFVLMSGMLSSCSVALQGGAEGVLSATFTAADDDIKGADADYRAMEAELRRQIAQIERDNPGYDEYRYHITEIGHDPYMLAAFLTVLYEDYTRAEVQDTLRALFEAQYSLSTSHSIETVTETRTVRVGESLGMVVTSGYCNCSICCGRYAGGPTASGVMPTADHTIAVDMYDMFLPFGTRVVMNGTEYVVEDTGPLTRHGVTFDVYYDDHDVAEAHGHQTWEAFLADDNGAQEVQVTQTTRKNVFTVDLHSTSLAAVIDSYGLTPVQKARYQVLLSTKGNKDYLFADDIYANAVTGPYADYRVPSEALSDVQFANMIHEAEKYLGYPYVWGGESPETSFDCSGFISWVINHCGNGWDIGRLTAEELRQYTIPVSPSEARPGDLIFFQGTYDTYGASHVGLYVGDGMMIHCGHPCQYTSINTEYWQAHFFTYGRMP